MKLYELFESTFDKNDVQIKIENVGILPHNWNYHQLKIELIYKGDLIGAAHFNFNNRNKRGKFELIQFEPEYRRKGLGTLLHDKLQKLGYTIDDPDIQSAQMKAFLKARKEKL